MADEENSMPPGLEGSLVVSVLLKRLGERLDGYGSK